MSRQTALALQSPATSLDDLAARWRTVPYGQCSDEFVLGEFTDEPNVLCIGEALGADEIRLSRPFIGESGQRLRTTLTKVGLAPRTVSFCNVIPRRPYDRQDKNRTPTSEEIRANKPYIFSLVQIFKPKIVILLGNTPLEAFTGRSKITEERGMEFQHEDFGEILFLPAVHPANTLYRPSSLPDFESDLKWAARLLNGDVLDAANLGPFPYITDADGVRAMVEAAGQAEFVYFDCEAGGIPPAEGTWHWDPRVKPVLVSFAWQGPETHTRVVEWNDETYPVLKAFFESDCRFVGQNVLQYDVPLLQSHGIQIEKATDTYLIARLLNENDSGGLKQRVRNTLGLVNHTPFRTKTEAGHFHSRWHEFHRLPEAERQRRIHYSGVDSWAGAHDWLNLREQFDKQPRLQYLYDAVLVPACRAAVEMERTGLPVNVNKLWRMALDLQREVRKAIGTIRSTLPTDAWKTVNPPKQRKRGLPTAGTNALVNPGSSQQLGRILFDLYGFPPVRITDAGMESTGEETLLKLLDLKGSPKYLPAAFTVLEAALTMRERRQTLNMFVRPFMERIKTSPIDDWRRTRTGWLHGRFHVAGTDTMRLASSEPNLQNIQRSIRHIFEAPLGWAFVNLDFNSLEVRGVADLSQDNTLLRLIRQGQDMHNYNTRKFLGLSDDASIDKGTRYSTKTLFFASVYGARENKIAETLRKKFRDAGLGTDQVWNLLRQKGIKQAKDPWFTLAEEWRKWMFMHYRSLEPWHNRVRKHVTTTGEITSWFSYTRHLPDALSTDGKAREEAVRQAINCVPQQLSLLTLIALRDLMRIRGDREDFKIIAQVHDSITLLVWEEVAEAWAAIAKDCMVNKAIFQEFGTSFSVPLEAEVSVRTTWA